MVLPTHGSRGGGGVPLGLAVIGRHALICFIAEGMYEERRLDVVML